jgi:hypothetical protein
LLPPRLSARRWQRPQRSLEVDFAPCHAANLRAALAGDDQQVHDVAVDMLRRFGGPPDARRATLRARDSVGVTTARAEGRRQADAALLYSAAVDDPEAPCPRAGAGADHKAASRKGDLWRAGPTLGQNDGPQGQLRRTIGVSAAGCAPRLSQQPARRLLNFSDDMSCQCPVALGSNCEREG